jgi:phospholipase C
MKLDRRDFLRTAAVASGAAVWGSASGSTRQTFLSEEERAAGLLPAPGESGIEHIVVVMMENRSFDHLLGWLPGAVGRQAGLTYTDNNGVPHSTYPLAPDFTGCPHPDPDHSYEGGRVEYNHGRMDGFLRAGSNDVYSIGYYVEHDLPFLSALARHYTTLDRYFVSILGPTFPNRLFLHSANTDRLSNTLDFTGLPTIWDSLAANGVSGTYYYSNLSFLSLWGLKYLGISSSYDQFLADAAAGNLPAVSFVDPKYTLTDLDTGSDDHPHSSVKRGDWFLARTFHAVANGPLWPSTIFIVTFDEWGGFFDHVRPRRAAKPAGDPDTDVVNGKVLLGFRVPAIVASPFSVGTPDRPLVRHFVFDHTSILKLIEWRWELPPLTARDASNDIRNLALALDFSNPNSTLPALPLPRSPRSHPCSVLPTSLGTEGAAAASPTTAWAALANSPRVEGWPVQK